MSLHFPLPKIRTFRFSLHTSRLSLHGEVTMVYGGAEIRNVREVLLVRERERERLILKTIGNRKGDCA